MKNDMKSIWLESYESHVPERIDPDIYCSVLHMCEMAMQKFQNRPAFDCLGSTLTYGDLDRLSGYFATFLQQRLGIKKGSHIAVMLPNILVFPITLLAIMRVGAVQVNINPLYTARELYQQLNDSEADSIVIFSGSTSILADVVMDTLVKNIITVDLGDGGEQKVLSPSIDDRLTNTIKFSDALSKGMPRTQIPIKLSGDDTLFLQYTGGMTGQSKAAVLSHRNLVSNVEQFKVFARRVFRPGKEVVITALPLYHIFALTVNFLCYFSVGARNYLIPNPRDVDSCIETIKNAKFTVITGVNTLFNSLLSHPKFCEVDLSSYQIAIGGGAPILPTTSQKWAEITNQEIKEGYGLSEASPVVTLNPLHIDTFSRTVGVPLPSTKVKILDIDDKETRIGTPGEICVRGPQVMSGYWNRKHSNADVFTEDGFFRTGDIGIFDSRGFLKIIDRKKDMIIVSGFNVYPNEIEAVASSFEGIAECSCIGIPDDKTGEAIILFVVKSSGVSCSEQEIIEHCRKLLATYKVPRQIRFLEGLPKSSVGKSLRKELRCIELPQDQSRHEVHL